MQTFEYKVVPAPRRGEKAKGIRTTEDRFAHALARVMNSLAAEGWEYVRADTLPVEERVGLTGRTTTFQHMLVFRRAVAARREDTPRPAVAPVAKAPEPEFEDADTAFSVPDLDPLDIAARRAAMVATPQFGNAPRVAASMETGLAPQVGPARGPSQAAE